MHALLVLDAENSPSSVVQWKNSAHSEQSIEWEHHKLGVFSAQPQTFVRGLVELLQFDDSLWVHGDVNQFIFCARRLAQDRLCKTHVTTHIPGKDVGLIQFQVDLDDPRPSHDQFVCVFRVVFMAFVVVIVKIGIMKLVECSFEIASI